VEVEIMGHNGRSHDTNGDIELALEERRRGRDVRTRGEGRGG